MNLNSAQSFFNKAGTIQSDGLIARSIDQLQLKFDFNNKEDKIELEMILKNILHYPSNQISELHNQANMLGNFDIRGQGLKNRAFLEENNRRQEYCPCCGFIRQENQIKVCQNLIEINNIGISTFLYFKTLKNILVLLGVMALTYSIYALVTDIIATFASRQIFFLTDILSISLAAKQRHPTDINKRYYFIQAWIGAGTVILWGLIIIFLKYIQTSAQKRVEYQTKSASDFSIVIQNFPTDLQKEDLQAQFNQYFLSINNVPENLKKPLIIKKFNKGKPFYLNEDDLKDKQLLRIMEDISKITQIFRSWIFQRQQNYDFSTIKSERVRLYKQYDKLLKERKIKIQQIIQTIKNKYKQKNKQEVTTLFVTFENSYARKLICDQNTAEINSRIRYYLSCCKNQNRFICMNKNNDLIKVKIYRAPEPQDIIWTNLGVSKLQKRCRKILTYLITLLVLGISFAIVYGLSTAQKNQTNRVLSFIISLVISIINAILGQIIRKVTIYERDYTSTEHQTSLAIKSVVAQLINSILVPIISNYYIQQNNIYSTNGLADDIFYLAITLSFLPPILKILDPYYLYVRITAWWKKRPNSRLYINQQQLNAYNQRLFFEIGYQYIYLINLFLFTCFFVSLQPIIVGFALCGLGLMYWCQKYTVFSRSKRPVPGTNLVNTAMTQLILLGGVVYSLGSLTWSNFLSNGIPPQALLPNLISTGFGVLMFLAPYNTIFSLVFNDEQQQNLIYDQNRLYLPSEYDRLNPSTSEEAFKEYIAFIQKTKQQLRFASKQTKQSIMNIFRQQGRNAYGNFDAIPNMLGKLFPQSSYDLNGEIMTILNQASLNQIIPFNNIGLAPINNNYPNNNINQNQNPFENQNQNQNQNPFQLLQPQFAREMNNGLNKQIDQYEKQQNMLNKYGFQQHQDHYGLNQNNAFNLLFNGPNKINI